MLLIEMGFSYSVEVICLKCTGYCVLLLVQQYWQCLVIIWCCWCSSTGSALSLYGAVGAAVLAVPCHYMVLLVQQYWQCLVII